MTNKQSKQQDDEQAFIDSLYTELADEQPSEQLDQRILAAAHKAVASQPVGQTATTPKKRKSWFFPVATAASLLLMLTLFDSQMHSPSIQKALQPSLSAPSMDSINLTTEQAMHDSNEMVVAQDSLEAEFADQAHFITQAQQQQTERRNSIAAKRDSEAAKDAMQPLQHSKKSKANSVPTEALTSAPVAQSFATPKQAPLLTTAQYLLLKNNHKHASLSWRLIDDSENSYLLELHSEQSQQRGFYRLNKDSFNIDSSNSSEQILDFNAVTIKQ